MLTLLGHLQTQFVVMGDFNIHNLLWCSGLNDAGECKLADIFDDFNISVLKYGGNTNFCAATKSFSAIDFTILSSAIVPLFGGVVNSDLFNNSPGPAR